MATTPNGIATCQEAVRKDETFLSTVLFYDDSLNIKCVVFDKDKYAVSEYGKIKLTNEITDPNTGEVIPATYVNGRFIFEVNNEINYLTNLAVKYDDIKNRNCRLITDKPVPEPGGDSSTSTSSTTPTPEDGTTIIQYKAPAKLEDTNISYSTSGAAGALSQVILFPWLKENGTYRLVNHSFDNTTHIGTIKISPKISEIPNYAFTRFAGIMENNQWVYYVIAGTDITEIWIPDSIETIGDYAFAENSDLRFIHYYGDNPNQIQNIGNNAFLDCKNLKKFEFGKNITSIGSKCFKGCSSLTEVLWNCIGTDRGYILYDENISTITVNGGDWTVRNTPFYQSGSFDLRNQITTFIFGDSVKIIPDYICRDMTNLTNLNNNTSKLIIPSSVVGIGEEAFNWCENLLYIDFKSTSNARSIYIRDNAFNNLKDLIGVTLPSLQEWCSTTFSNKNSNPLWWMHGWFSWYESPGSSTVKTFDTSNYYDGIFILPSGITNIPAYAFSVDSDYVYGNTKPYRLSIPETCLNIYAQAFYGWDWVTHIYVRGSTPPVLNGSAFDDVDESECILHVPSGSITAYLNDDLWGDFTNILVFNP